MTDLELLEAFAEADKKAKAAVYPWADGFTHRRLSEVAGDLRRQCVERGLSLALKAVEAEPGVMNPYGHS